MMNDDEYEEYRKNHDQFEEDLNAIRSMQSKNSNVLLEMTGAEWSVLCEYYFYGTSQEGESPSQEALDIITNKIGPIKTTEDPSKLELSWDVLYEIAEWSAEGIWDVLNGDIPEDEAFPMMSKVRQALEQ